MYNPKVLSFLIITTIIVTGVRSLPTEACTINSDCPNYPYDICKIEQSFCTRKPLLLPYFLEIVGLIVLCLMSILSTAAGIGGGSFMIAIMLGFFNFETKGAIAMSNGIMFLNSLAITIMVFGDKHPIEKHKPLIDMNLALVFITPMMAGAVFGSIVAVLIPSSL